MNRNSNYIFKEKIKDETGHAKKAQVGVDLSLAKVEIIKGTPCLDTNSKLHGVEYEEAPCVELKGEKIYSLQPNMNYAIEFEQGLNKLLPNEWGLIIQRSSLLRAGCHIVSSIWDPGFETGVMGTTLVTGNVPIAIPVGARVAQMLIFDCEDVASEDQYNGRWQNKANA